MTGWLRQRFQLLLWPLTLFETASVFREEAFPLRPGAKRTRYPFRVLRYWWVINAIGDEVRRLDRPVTIVDVGSEKGLLKNIVPPIANSRWIGLDRDVSNEYVLGAGYDEYGSKKGMGADSNYVGGYTGWEPFLKTKGNEEFVKKYFAQFKDDRFLDSHVIYGYISGQVLERAVNQSGSLNRDKIRDAIAKMKFQSFMPGHFEVDPKTGMQIGHQWASFQWQNGKKVIVYPKSDATGELLYPAPPWKSRK